MKSYNHLVEHINSTTGTYRSISFISAVILMVTLLDFIHRLKSLKHINRLEAYYQGVKGF